MGMPRTTRIAPGGMIFHVLNRANARITILRGTVELHREDKKGQKGDRNNI